MADLHYIKSSIFYHPDSWATLIAKGIRPWKKKFPDLPLLIEMNEERGPSLRCIISIDADSYSSVASAFDEHFRDFIRHNPSPPSAPSEATAFFMDFPVNRICYNLYQHAPYAITLPSARISLDAFFHEFSNQLVRQEYQGLEEMLSNRFIFSLQLTAILTYCFSANKEHGQQCWSHFIGERLSAHPNAPIIIKEMEQQYGLYAEDLTALINDTWTNLAGAGPSWQFQGFRELFTDLMVTIHSLSEESQMHALGQVFRKMNHKLCVANELLVASFLERSLNAPQDTSAYLKRDM